MCEVCSDTSVNTDIQIQIAMFSPGKIQGMMGGHGLGGACDHIKAFGLYIKELGLLG